MNSREPAKIPTDIIQEIICRQLVNLPKEEKEFPRILNNIEEACWFYTDYYLRDGVTMDKNQEKTFQKKFAQRIFKEWSYLSPYLPKLKQLQDEYRIYKSKIPSYGALIFNQKLDSILFIIYHNPRDKIVNKLDFAKGKVDQGESPVECALREVHEETQLTLGDQVNENQYVKVETIKNRMVTLFFVDGIEMDAIRQPINRKEVDALKWISVSDYVQEVLRQNNVESILGHSVPAPKFCTYYVKTFAYFVSEWQTLRKHNSLSPLDFHHRVSIRDSDLFNQCIKGKQILEQVCANNREYDLLYKELPFFLQGFFYHHVLEDYKMAKKLYKEALRRAEFTKGCYQMILSIYMFQFTYQKKQADFKGFQSKVDKLESVFGHFLQYEQSLRNQKKRIIDHVHELESEEIGQGRLPKEVLIIEISKFIQQHHFQKLSEPSEQFKTKFQALRMLKFDPFVLKITVAGWQKKSQNNSAFYKLKMPFGANIMSTGKKAQQANMLEHAIIETHSERNAIFLSRMINNNKQQQIFCNVVHVYEVTIDDYPLNCNAAESLMVPQSNQIQQVSQIIEPAGQEIRKYVQKKPVETVKPWEIPAAIRPPVVQASYITNAISEMMERIRKEIQMPSAISKYPEQRQLHRRRQFIPETRPDVEVYPDEQFRLELDMAQASLEENDKSFERKLNQITDSFKLTFHS